MPLARRTPSGMVREIFSTAQDGPERLHRRPPHSHLVPLGRGTKFCRQIREQLSTPNDQFDACANMNRTDAIFKA